MIDINNDKTKHKNKCNGDVDDDSEYKRKFDLKRDSWADLVHRLYNKENNDNQSSKFIDKINSLLFERVKNGNCTQSQINDLKCEIENTKLLRLIKNQKIDTEKKIKRLIKSIQRITKVKLSNLNRTDNIKDVAHVYDDQILASLNIINNMLLSKTDSSFSRYMMLFADMQSGKTGVIANVIYILESNDELREYLGIDFDSSLFITSMSDVANKLQLSKDISEAQCRCDGNTILMNNGIKHNPDLSNSVIKGNTKKLKNCIIFMDESHLASDIYSVINDYLQRGGVNLNGSSNLLDNNVWLITVSATPYEEHVGSILYNRKDIIKLSHGPNYKGLNYFLRSGVIEQAFELTTDEGVELFHKELDKFNCKKGYYLVRVSNLVDISKFEHDEFEIKTYFEKQYGNIENIPDINSVLKIKPDSPTLIFIKEKMKQSYKLEKSNLVMLFDRTSKNDNLYRTSFIVQSFVGRACGYHNFNFKIYTDKEHVKQHLNYINNNKNVPLSKNTSKVVYDSSSTELMLLEFESSPEIFQSILELNNKSNKKKIANFILSAYPDNHIINGFINNENKYNATFFYSKTNKTYSNYITRAYDDIKNHNGKSNYKFIRGNESEIYKKGDYVFALYIDVDNSNIIIAHKHICDDIENDILEIHNGFKIHNIKEVYHASSYSDYNPPISLKDYKKSNVSTSTKNVGEIQLANSIIKIFLDKQKNLVLQKNTIVEVENFPGYVENYIVSDDIKRHCNNIEDAKSNLEFLCKIISPNITIDDIKNNNESFIILLRFIKW